jgi:hypothetical protein
MSRRTVGHAAVTPSNAASGGVVGGENVGKMNAATVVESLQESVGALNSQGLYYEEFLGQFNAPSFQKAYGIKNETIQNVEQWGENGIFTLNNDMFWNGPAAIKIDVPISYRWRGTVTSGYQACANPMYPTFFYSWGAGFAAVRQWRFNMGGAAQYTLDRYANFISIMGSCFTRDQRYGLMKISGGGLIADTTDTDTLIGLGRPTTSFGSIENRFFNGYVVGGEPTPGAAPYYPAANAVMPKRIRVPTIDHWIVPFKTPHTNYNNPRIRRRPLDTKLFSEHFTVDFWLSNFDEFADSGSGLVPIYQVDGVNKACQVRNSNYFAIERAGTSRAIPINHFRQYSNLYGYVNTTATTKDDIDLRFFHGGSVNNFLGVFSAGTRTLTPTNEDVFPRIGDLLTPETLPKPAIETMVASLRLTNDMLGAYDVLKTRTDLAVYYPFQHFTTQVYTTQNLCYGKASLDDYIQRSTTYFPTDEATITKCSTAINIPVNPMTAMYVAIAREKDRKALGISKAGGYSPCLFWNFLHLPYLSVTYGSDKLVEYKCSTAYLSEQLYEHVSPIQIPYKGGFCLRSEFAKVAEVHGRTGLVSQASDGASSLPACANQYNGILRNSWIYEISLVEMEPLRNEAFFQQTPSFLGEELNLTFQIEPSTLSFQSSYDPITDLSYLSDYSVTSKRDANPTYVHGAVEAKAVGSTFSDLTGVFNDQAGATYPGLLATEKGNGEAALTDVWHMNSDNNLMVIVIYAQNALWQLNPNMSKMVFTRG